jgi:hypothetical protein
MIRRVLAAAFAASLAVQSPSAVAQTDATSVPEPSRIKPTPLVTELLRIVDAERERIVTIRRDIASTRDRARILELQRQIEAVKRRTERDLLVAQLEAARREGRAEVAAVLERAVAALDAPRAATGAKSAASAAR